MITRPALRKLIRKNCPRLAKIVFQLNAVKFAIELILWVIQNNDQSSLVLLGESTEKASVRCAAFA